MWYVIIAIISGAVGAILMGLAAGMKIKEAANEAYWLGVEHGKRERSKE